MSTFTISMLDEGAGFKASRTFTVTDDEMRRIVWSYDACFGCDGDPKVVFDTITDRLLAVLVDHAHECEMRVARDPITPIPE